MNDEETTGNVLLAPDGAVSAVIDWEAATDLGLATVDLAHLLITTRALVQRQELGRAVAQLLTGPLAAQRPREGAPSMRTAVLLAWLHHVTGNLAKAERYTRHGRWIRRNIDPVLAAMAPREATVHRLRHRIGDPRWVVATVAILAGAALWIAALGADPRAMTDIGLVSVLPATFFLGLLVLTAGYAIALRGRRQRPAVLLGLLGALVVVLHATPPLVYGTLRYSWAWKHVGIVDYIQRHGGVDPSIGSLPVYHNWPGFFGLDTLLTQLAGLPDAVGQAVWAPVAFNLLGVASLVFALTSLTRDHRAVWAAAWLYVAASWVGQDYFAPQALAFVLYLLLIGVTARWLRHRTQAGPLAAAAILIVAITVSHPLTAVMVPLALAALVLCGVCHARWLPLAAAAVVGVWDLTFAAPYVSGSLGSVLDSVKAPWVTTESGLTATSQLSDGQEIVALAGRGLVVAIVLLAACGVVRLHRCGRLREALPVLALAGAPVALFGAGDYGGEVLFRLYLFSLPFLALLAGEAFGRVASTASALAFGAVASLLFGAFLFAHYGKDDQYHFTDQEITAARYLYAHAPPGSLLIEGTGNYPAQFTRYEQFRYVALEREPPASHLRFVADPVGVFSAWMRDRRFPGAYLVITRSQKAEVAEVGVLPAHALSTIEERLLASRRFEVLYRNRDAIVFELAAGQRE